jgi:hypothetical protein
MGSESRGIALGLDVGPRDLGQVGGLGVLGTDRHFRGFPWVIAGLGGMSCYRSYRNRWRGGLRLVTIFNDRVKDDRGFSVVLRHPLGM